MLYRLTIPARINLLGNPTDALEGDYAVISAAVDLFAGAEVTPAEQVELEFIRPPALGGETLARQVIPVGQFPLPCTGELRLLTAACNGLYRFSAEFRAQAARQGWRLAVWTEVPRQSGLGGSSLLVLLTLAGLREVYGLDRQRHNDYVLAELAQRVESQELGITCGYADRYVPLFGGLAYVDYRGKLAQQPLGAEPYATYERLDPWVDTLPLVVFSTGLARDSGDVHARLRPRYLAEWAAWQTTGGPPPPLVAWMQAVGELAWRGKIALLAGDWPTVGQYLNQNHALVNQMMVYSGFAAGAGTFNNRLIELALAHGALGAKLTGAGGGGSVYALVRPGEEAGLLAAWEQAAAAAGLTTAQGYCPRLVRHGLRVAVI